MTSIFRRVRSKLALLWFTATERPRFAQLGHNSFLYSPYRVDGAEGVSLGEGSVFQRGGWLYCVGDGAAPPSLRIGKGCVFGYNNHIAAASSVRIGDHVLTANNVYISDNLHEYRDITRPVMHQPVVVKGKVDIGDGCWLGENVAVIGASVGRNCVIGANAVVTRDIPDYSVAVGIPARVIRRYDATSRQWHAVGGDD